MRGRAGAGRGDSGGLPWGPEVGTCEVAPVTHRMGPSGPALPERGRPWCPALRRSQSAPSTSSWVSRLAVPPLSLSLCLPLSLPPDSPPELHTELPWHEGGAGRQCVSWVFLLPPRGHTGVHPCPRPSVPVGSASTFKTLVVGRIVWGMHGASTGENLISCSHNSPGHFLGVSQPLYIP